MKKLFFILLFLGILSAGSCASPGTDAGPDPRPAHTTPDQAGPVPEEEIPLAENQIAFSKVGPILALDLIDLEFLPDGSGASVAAAKDGELFFLGAAWDLLDANTEDLKPLVFTDDNERGVHNIVLDPDFGSNGFLYVFYSAQAPAIVGINGAVDLLDRFTVTVDAGVYRLGDRVTILKVDRTVTDGFGLYHHGGGMIFLEGGELVLALGDGGVSYGRSTQVSQNPDKLMGKVHRFLPSRAAGVGGLDPASPDHGVSDVLPSVYALGFRNPFSLVAGPDGKFWVGDVGFNDYEEIDLITAPGQNFGWPLYEGPTSPQPFRNPVHGYAHVDETFIDVDPTAHGHPDIKFHAGVVHPDGNKAIMVLGFHEHRLYYTDFYLGWIRALEIDDAGQILGDSHMGHYSGMTGLKANPADGLLYGVSLFGSEQILRVDDLHPDPTP